MGRIRTVKPELLKHEDLFELELTTGLPIRIAFVGLFTVADREGRFKWRPRALKLDVLPYDDCDFSRVLDALMTRDFVRKYAYGTEEYGVITTFGKHQVINNRESDSDLPAPTQDSYISSTSTREPRVDDALDAPLVHAQGEGKGREGKGKGKEGKEQYIAPSGADGSAVVVGEAEIQDRRKQHEKREAVQQVFDYWKERMGHPRAQLDNKRAKAIAARLHDGYSTDDLLRAVDGCRLSPHHMGQNDNRTVYDDIELICRDGVRVDKFIALVARGTPHMSPGLQQQIDVLNDWMRESGDGN
jgi:hypothetical protein